MSCAKCCRSVSVAAYLLCVLQVIRVPAQVTSSIERSTFAAVNLDRLETSNENIIVEELQSSSTRQGKSTGFPFYTIGRFQNSVCTGSNRLDGTCVLGGECKDDGGIAAGTCSTLTRQAVCCVYQSTCAATTDNNNTYFVSPGYPAAWAGGSACGITVQPCSSGVCQLRIDFLSTVLATPNGDGTCNTDVLTVSGGASLVPSLCGVISGQHVYVDFNGFSPIQIAVVVTPGVTFQRSWNIKLSQINCDSAQRAPSGCLQYHFDQAGFVSSFNYGSMANEQLNAASLEGTRQLVNQRYAVCVRRWPGRCSITWSQLAGDSYSFTLTGDVTGIDSALIGTAVLQEQDCAADYIVIPNAAQSGVVLTNDRFCGLGLAATTSNVSPFNLYVVTNGTETLDVANRGFALNYVQNLCPVM